MLGKRFIGTMLCLAVLSMAFFVAVADDAYADDPIPTEEPSKITKLRGYIYDIPAQEERQVIAGVTVTTWTQSNDSFETVTTKADGSFEVEYNDNVRYISFTMAEFTVKGWSSELTKYGDTGKFEINLKDDSESGGVHDLFDDSGYTALISRTNASVFGMVTTSIDDNDVPIENAVITLTYNKNTFSATTDSAGYFIINCSSGVPYDMRVTAGGFFDWTMKSVVPSDEAVSVELTQKNHDIIMDLDLTHTLALFGILIVILLIIISVYLIRRPEKTDGLYVVNDLEPKNKKK